MSAAAGRCARLARRRSPSRADFDRRPPDGARLVPWLLAGVVALAGAPASAREVVPYTVSGDGIAAPLAGLAGDAARGRALVANRQQGLCLLCHSGPFPEERFQGDLAPSLAGAGARWSAAQLRLRLVDSGRVQPGSIMPAYHRGSEGLARVGPAWRDRPLFSAQQIEDVVAFLTTLKHE